MVSKKIRARYFKCLTRSDKLNFTPGPWEFISKRFADEGVKGRYEIRSISFPMHWLAEVGPSEQSFDEAKANAQLISAAPDMYEALRELYDEQNGAPLLRREKQWQEAMKKARKALEKAEGKE